MFNFDEDWEEIFLDTDEFALTAVIGMNMNVPVLLEVETGIVSYGDTDDRDMHPKIITGRAVLTFPVYDELVHTITDTRTGEVLPDEYRVIDVEENQGKVTLHLRNEDLI